MDFTKYIESGISVIPLLPKSKKPFIKGWERYCDKPAEPIEAQVWNEKYPNHNIGACLGIPIDDEYVLGALDIDSTDESFINSFPPSPIRKTGKKGETRFYRFHKTAQNRNVLDKDGVGYEILLKGRQTVLPPSIHPDTEKPYVWLTPDTLLNMDLKELPIFEYVPHSEDVERDDLEVVGKFKSPDGKRCPHGSFNRAKKLCHALIAQRLTSHDAVMKLLEWDNESNDVKLFSDKYRPDYAGKEPYENALSMYLGCLKTVNKTRKSKGQEPELPVVEEIEFPLAFKAEPMKELPKLTPNLEAIKEEIMRNAHKPNDVYATCGALSLMSVLASTKYIFAGTRPNLYSMLLADAGAGKDVVRRMINAVLSHESLMGYNLMGLNSYVSSPALVLNLPNQRTRIDVIDEFSSFMKSASAANSHYKSEVLTELNQLYSIGTGYYGGIKAISRKENGACFAPSITLTAMIQPQVFIDSATSDMFNNGFFPRFLYFYSDKKQDIKADTMLINSNIWSNTVKIANKLFPVLDTIDYSEMKAKQIADIGLIEPRLTEMTLPDNIRKNALDAFEKINDKINESKDVQKNIYARAIENMKKLITIITLSRGTTVINESDIEMAYNLVITLIENTNTMLGIAAESSVYGRLKERVIEQLKKHGVLTSNQYIDIFKKTPYARKQITTDLEESEIMIVNKNGRKTTYHINIKSMPIR